jgi:hypothetical protein
VLDVLFDFDDIVTVSFGVFGESVIIVVGLVVVVGVVEVFIVVVFVLLVIC